MTWILEQLKKSIHNTTAAGINDFSGEFLSLEDNETHHSVVLDKSISKFDLMINNLLFVIELQVDLYQLKKFLNMEIPKILISI
jgi:hypothetical protein